MEEQSSSTVRNYPKVMPPQPSSSQQSNPVLGPSFNNGMYDGQHQAAPPLPPRPPPSAPAGMGYYSRNTYGTGLGYAPRYSAYGASNLYPSYSSYPMNYGTGYDSMYTRPYGNTYDSENRVVAVAEDSARGAFQALESVVHTFGSISAMLDATLQAVHSAFHAVLGLADHFGRLRSSVSSVLSALAIFRAARWAISRLLYLLGLRKQRPVEDSWRQIWSTVTPNPDGKAAAVLSEADLKKSRSSWPITVFMSIILAAPYLIWRILRSLQGSTERERGWSEGQGEHFLAKADYNFNPMQDTELALTAGQKLRLAPKNLQPRHVRGWLLASNLQGQTGLVPANHITILGQATGEGVNPNTPNSN